MGRRGGEKHVDLRSDWRDITGVEVLGSGGLQKPMVCGNNGDHLAMRCEISR